jgi:pimeloyl-ACP methyl ester carboxylesterase
VDEGPAALGLEAHGDDAHEVPAALTKSPAHVLGSSIGTLIGLELTARHADQVRTLVAHEPPAAELLPEPERASVEHAQEEVEETYRREGVAAAMQRFAVMAGLNFADREPEVELPGPTDPRVAARSANPAFFFTHDAPAVRRYRLDIAALRAAPTRIVPAAGRTSSESWPHRCAAGLAERLDRELVRFPGGHAGYTMHPRGFAARLREVLDDLPDSGRE